MTYVDSAVLNFTERLCRRFQTWTGRTNVWLAFQLTNLSIVVYFIWVADLYWLRVDLALRVFVALFCGGVFYVLTRTIFKMSIEVSETEAYRRLAKGLRNPRRIRDTQLRIAFLTLSIVLSGPLWFAYVTLHVQFVILTEALTLLTTVVLYVLACDPLPPCAGKVTEWLRGMARAVATASSRSTGSPFGNTRTGSLNDCGTICVKGHQCQLQHPGGGSASCFRRACALPRVLADANRRGRASRCACR